MVKIEGFEEELCGSEYKTLNELSLKERLGATRLEGKTTARCRMESARYVIGEMLERIQCLDFEIGAKSDLKLRVARERERERDPCELWSNQPWRERRGP